MDDRSDWLSDPAMPEALWRSVAREATTCRPTPESEQELVASLQAAYARLRRCQAIERGRSAQTDQPPD